MLCSLLSTFNTFFIQQQISKHQTLSLNPSKKPRTQTSYIRSNHPTTCQTIRSLNHHPLPTIQTVVEAHAIVGAQTLVAAQNIVGVQTTVATQAIMGTQNIAGRRTTLTAVHGPTQGTGIASEIAVLRNTCQTFQQFFLYHQNSYNENIATYNRLKWTHGYHSAKTKQALARAKASLKALDETEASLLATQALLVALGEGDSEKEDSEEEDSEYEYSEYEDNEEEDNEEEDSEEEDSSEAARPPTMVAMGWEYIKEWRRLVRQETGRTERH